MTAKEFEQLKIKIDQARTQKARAEGVKARIEENWKKDYGLSNIKEVQGRISEIEKQVKKDTERLDSLYFKLEKVTDWDSI